MFRPLFVEVDVDAVKEREKIEEEILDRQRIARAVWDEILARYRAALRAESERE